MSATSSISPAFGFADLTNCERELIQYAGSIQPHGIVMVLLADALEVVQASNNTIQMLGVPVDQVLGHTLHSLGGDCAGQVLGLKDASDLLEPAPLKCTLAVNDDQRAFEGTVYRHPEGVLVLELEPTSHFSEAIPTADIANEVLLAGVANAIQRFSAAASLNTLADAVAQCVHDLTGYDRVMVYRFDADGHGKVIAEARDPRLESLLGHNYPASDIPQRARELYLRNRLRLLVDVHYEPVALVPRLLPTTGTDLDMSLCQLRSMSPLHLQYLKNMGVTATLVISLVREGKLWGLIAAHHYSPRHLRSNLRLACDLLAEVATTRIAAIENYAHAQIALLVQRLEQRLIEATSEDGDWRQALFRNPRVVLQPLESTGAALYHQGEILTAGEVPSTPELKALLDWIESSPHKDPFVCSSVSKSNPDLASLTPMASGVLAVKLSLTRSDYLVWFRREQLQTVTWAGDPYKPFEGESPLDLSPRRSFSAWSELVRGTALPWTDIEIALGRAVGVALVDIIVQVEAVRLLIGEYQLAGMRSAVQCSRAAVTIASAAGRILFSSDAYHRLVGHMEPAVETLAQLADAFRNADVLNAAFQSLGHVQQSWRGEGLLKRNDERDLPLAIRGEAVLGRDGTLVGRVLTFTDQSDLERASKARHQLEQGLQPRSADADEVIRNILTNASIAAMDIVDGPHDATTARQLNEVEQSMHRAARLYSRIRT